MCDRDVELDGRERARERRVDVARDDHEVGLLRFDHGGDARERTRCLLRMAARADPEEDVRLGHPELAEEDVGHLLVVVLSGVDEDEPVVRCGVAESADAAARPS